MRRQLYDAFIIANALGKLTLDIPNADFVRVYAWLGSLHTFITALFVAEHRFLYPLIDQCMKKAKTPDGAQLYLPEALTVRGRQNAKATILDLLSNARKTRDVATGETPAKINALRYALDEFGRSILDYFAAMEKFVPKLLKRSIRKGDREKDKMERKMFEYLLTQPHGAMLAALLMQCIESRSKRHAFLQRNIRKAKERDAFKEHVKRVEATHMQLAAVFDSVATRYERRFNVTKFLECYGANAEANGEQTLAMLGDLDIDDENPHQYVERGQPIMIVPDVVLDQKPQLIEAVQSESEGEGLDDDFIEIHTEEVVHVSSDAVPI